MAFRPVFTVADGNRLFDRENVEFEYFGGFSDAQKQRCINSLHQSYLRKYPDQKILEISSKSEDELGVKLSAFNLMINLGKGKKFSVESAFQSSKVFEYGGPYTDLLYASSRAAKKDSRLKESGRLIAFKFAGTTFESEPKTYFYNWLYINALHLNPELAEQIVQYDAFTDIAFNPEKSLNCQAEAAAIYVSLYRQGLLEQALKGKKSFLKTVYPNHKI